MMGFDEHGSYIVLKENGNVIYPPGVDPLDEMQLVRRGIPSGAAAVSVETQTEISDVPPPPAPRARAPPPPVVNLPVGTRVGVTWTEPARGEGRVRGGEGRQGGGGPGA